MSDAPAIAVGDRVRLRSGSPSLLVEWIVDGIATVVWDDQRAAISLPCLVREAALDAGEGYQEC
jgi:hypothetical protein